MEPIITINDYPIGWEWLFRGLYICYHDTDTYDFATFDKEATNGEPPYPVIEINRKGLAYFLNEDQGYKSGISICKCLDISSEEEYMKPISELMN